MDASSATLIFGDTLTAAEGCADFVASTSGMERAEMIDLPPDPNCDGG